MEHYNPFDPRDINCLPTCLPILPLPGALLLPRGRLPLNIFEARYLSMIWDSLGEARMVGMIQPCESADDAVNRSRLFTSGCVGRITQFRETDDGRVLIILRGLCRFDIIEEIDTPRNKYRRARVCYTRFVKDLDPDSPNERSPALDRERLFPLLRDYFNLCDMSVDWDAISSASDVQLITALSMMCPFSPMDKQALLESPDGKARGKALIALLDFAVHQARSERLSCADSEISSGPGKGSTNSSWLH